MIVLIIVAFAFIGGLANYFDEEYAWETWASWLAAIGIVLGIGAAGWSFVSYNINNSRGEAGSIEVKYRSDRVPVGSDSFEALGFTSDNIVKNAWYDAGEEYLVIRLNSTNYHYCEVPRSIWSDLKNTRSPYAYYQNSLRGNYDCRTNYLPAY